MQSVYFLSKNQPDDDGSNFSELSSGLVLEGPEMQLENREELDVNPGHQPTPHPRAVGAPLPRGAARMGPRATPPRIPIPVPMPSRALTTPAIPPVGEDRSSRVQPAKAPSSNLQPSNVQRAAQALRSAVPFVQRLLPLLDGNIVTAISNVLNHQPKPAPPVSIAPIQQGISELQLQQRELSDQMAVQNASLKRVEDHLELVREATDRNTLEQQELMEDLKAVGKKVNLVATVALTLLLVSVLVNVLLYLHIERILP